MTHVGTPRHLSDLEENIKAGEYMDFVMGLLTGVVFLLVFFAGQYVEQRKNKRPKPPDPDDRQIEEAKKLNEQFQQVMSYDVSKAIERKKV